MILIKINKINWILLIAGKINKIRNLSKKCNIYNLLYKVLIKIITQLIKNFVEKIMMKQVVK